MVLFSAVKIFDVDRRFIGVLIERGITRSRYRQIVIGGVLRHKNLCCTNQKLLTLMRPNCTVCSHSDFRFSPCGNFDPFKTPLKIKVKELRNANREKLQASIALLWIRMRSLYFFQDISRLIVDRKSYNKLNHRMLNWRNLSQFLRIQLNKKIQI